MCVNAYAPVACGLGPHYLLHAPGGLLTKRILSAHVHAPPPADNDHTDIPVPDFTYKCYPEARYKNSSWPSIQVRGTFHEAGSTRVLPAAAIAASPRGAAATAATAAAAAGATAETVAGPPPLCLRTPPPVCPHGVAICCKLGMVCAELHGPLPLQPRPPLAQLRLCSQPLLIVLPFPSCCSISCPVKLQDLLQRRSDMVGWHERHPELFHRSNWAVGPRRGLMPLLQTYSNGSGGIGCDSAICK